ncbi:MAG: tetratricopeptide repeat protein, partial [Methanocorpusculum sp.]|nr:tetratricopeptide repeat protein [Methanocorpusculum sp.]
MAKKAMPQVTNPSDAVLWCKKAAELMGENDNKGAVYCYEESLKLRPAVPDVWFNLGCLFEKLGDKNAALGAFQTASKMFAADFRFPAERARILAGLGKYREAVDSINAALEVNPYSEL